MELESRSYSQLGRQLAASAIFAGLAVLDAALGTWHPLHGSHGQQARHWAARVLLQAAQEQGLSGGQGTAGPVGGALTGPGSGRDLAGGRDEVISPLLGRPGMQQLPGRPEPPGSLASATARPGAEQQLWPVAEIEEAPRPAPLPRPGSTSNGPVAPGGRAYSSGALAPPQVQGSQVQPGHPLEQVRGSSWCGSPHPRPSTN